MGPSAIRAWRGSRVADWPTVAATGHRYLNEDVRGWVWQKLHNAAVWLRDTHSTRVAISGLALGVDQMWAHAAVEAGLNLHAYIPFEQQPDRWRPEQQDRWRHLLNQATHVTVVGTLTATDPAARKLEATRLLHLRNDHMLSACDAAIAVLASSAVRGGTVSTVAKAQQRGLPVIHVDPDTRTIHLPDTQDQLPL